MSKYHIESTNDTLASRKFVESRFVVRYTVFAAIVGRFPSCRHVLGILHFMTTVLAFAEGTQWSLTVFVAICVAVVVALIAAVAFTAESRSESITFAIRSVGAVVLYVAAIAGLVQSGVFERSFIPYGPLFIVGSVSVASIMGLTRIGKRVSQHVSTTWLVLFQGFRLPLEIVLHDWYQSGTIPETMTWSGSNWDVVTGVLACLTFAFVNHRRWLAWLFNIVGIVLLLNVGRVAILSSPVPFGWGVEPPLELILFLPYAYIVPICVGGAALGHVVLTRQLLNDSVRKKQY